MFARYTYQMNGKSRYFDVPFCCAFVFLLYIANMKVLYYSLSKNIIMVSKVESTEEKKNNNVKNVKSLS